ncbi:hypothetical protein CC78DRAFT_529585 [Lojkania enalia]|uniref:F-box domain-containing protein n=1 Tax=Lojkania enalia TaxID=147567 RepID=A0A9P4KH04_9PLEO|nr:hypothetical protein CC78DRAFT_529585 [Didymosphaeria enalia]
MAQFWDLPPETMANVFAFIRLKQDQKSICLVCRVWRDLMAPYLWHTLCTTLLETPSRTLRTLIQPTNSILPHVRRLAVLPGHTDVPETAAAAAYDNLMLLLRALPRDRLQAFNFRYFYTPHSIYLLLLSQQKLTTLHLGRLLASKKHVYNESVRMGSIYPTSTIASLEHITIRISPPRSLYQLFRDNLRFVLENAPKFKRLRLRFSSGGYSVPQIGNIPKDLFEGPGQSPAFPHILQIEQLYLSMLPFSDEAGVLLRYIDFRRLQLLRIHYCKNLATLLTSIAASFAAGNYSLRYLKVDTSLLSYAETQRQRGAIVALLRSFSGLVHLGVNTRRMRPLDPNVIIGHSNTLTSLLSHSTATNGSPALWSVQELATILEACVNIKQLGIALPHIDLGPLNDLGSEFGFTTQSEYDVKSRLEAVLETIARHPNIHTLRILSVPTFANFDYRLGQTEGDGITGSELRYMQIAMQHFATQLMRFLHRNGSKIKVLAICPGDTVKKRLKRREPDANGHRWPDYFYIKGKMVDAMGREEIVASPFRSVAEMIESNILEDGV